MESAGQRLDHFLAISPLGISRSQAQKLIALEKVRINGELAPSKTKVKAGQKVRVEVMEAAPDHIKAQKIPLDVVYEDKDLLIINKPAGLVVHPGAGHSEGTLLNALAHRLGQAKIERLGLVHRLDKDTTGCLVVAKNEKAFKSLTKQIATHEAGRTYLALVWGRVEEEEGTIDAPLGRSRMDRRKFTIRVDHGKASITHFKVKERFVHATLLEVRLETGRTHQIRAHLLSIGRPIIGDPGYGGSLQGIPKTVRDLVHAAMNRQALHAWKLKLAQPSGRKAIEALAPIPKDFEKLLALLRR